MVDNAHAYAQSFVAVHEQVRIGDIVLVVQNAIRIDPNRRSISFDSNQTQKYWVVWFAEYLVDTMYPQAALKRGSSRPTRR